MYLWLLNRNKRTGCFPIYIVSMDAEQKQEKEVFPTLSRFHILASAASRKDKLVVS